MRQLVFVHGRAQEHKDSIALKAEWIAALREGLRKSGRELPIAESDIRFPYYGQTLYDLVNDVPADRVASVVTRGAAEDEAARQFMQSVLDEVQEKAEITDADVQEVVGGDVVERGVLNFEWVQGILSAIDRRIPFASGASIALATYDVYMYLRNPGTSSVIDRGVRDAISSEVETVVVSHSLGTVVAYNVLRRDGEGLRWRVPEFITLGSPLGVTAIRKSLTPLEHPKCVGKWYNAWDTRDVVALYALDRDHFRIRPAIENYDAVRNHTENRHGIAGYLDDEQVARRIYDALVATASPSELAAAHTGRGSH